VIGLEGKLHMINKYQAGITKAKIARMYGLNESTVRHILDQHPEAESYCKILNLDFKILFILDHPTALNDLCGNVKVIYLPTNTTSIIQPMDQGVVSSFKAYYLRRTFT
jgi:DNA-binding transcriptional regulator LsrR (DeoR family)